MAEMGLGADRLVEDVPGHGHDIPAVVGEADPPDVVPDLGPGHQVVDVPEEVAHVLVASLLGVQEPPLRDLREEELVLVGESEDALARRGAPAGVLGLATRSSCLARRYRDMPLESPRAAPPATHRRDHASIPHAWPPHRDMTSSRSVIIAPVPTKPATAVTSSTAWPASQEPAPLDIIPPQSIGGPHAVAGIICHLLGRHLLRHRPRHWRREVAPVSGALLEGRWRAMSTDGRTADVLAGFLRDVMEAAARAQAAIAGLERWEAECLGAVGGGE